MHNAGKVKARGIFEVSKKFQQHTKHCNFDYRLQADPWSATALHLAPICRVCYLQAKTIVWT